MARKAAASKPIAIKAANTGKLHAATGTPAGQKIPPAKLQAAAKSKNPTTRKRAQFAINAATWNHTSKKGK